MKNTLILSTILLLASLTGSAQQKRGDRIPNFRIERRFNNDQLTRTERFRIRNDQFRYKITQRRALRDGMITPEERRRLIHMKRQNRSRIFRLKHNLRQRVI